MDQRQARGREGGFILTDQREAGKHHCFIFLPIYCEHCKLLPKKFLDPKGTFNSICSHNILSLFETLQERFHI